MTEQRTAAAWVISPVNAVQCLIAHYFFQKHMKQSIKLCIYNYYPTTNTEFSDEVFQIVKKIVACIDADIECHQIQLLEDTDFGQFDYIYYAHDVVGGFLNILKSQNPRAKTLCYGDSLGQYFKKEVHLGFLAGKKHWKNFIKDFFKEKSPSADYAVLTIPVSQSKLPTKTTLLIPDHDLALSIFTQCANNFPDVLLYCKNMLAQAPKEKSFLFLTENMAEGHFISIEREMDLYIDTIRQHCPIGSFILVKPHPGEQIDRVALFQQALGKDYIFQKFDPSLKRVPIEFFKPLVSEFKVIGKFYPSLSLKYLYDIDVIQPFSAKIIEEYFEEKFWASYKNAVDLNMIPLKRLQNWDGKSLLYNGK